MRDHQNACGLHCFGRLSARARGIITDVHADREGCFGALENKLLALGIRLSVTQGSYPQVNGLAEQAVGGLSRMARGVLATYRTAVQASLWPFAMALAAQLLCGPKLPPFGAKVLARHPPKVAPGKLTVRAVPMVYMHKSTRTQGATLAGLLGNNRAHARVAA